MIMVNCSYADPKWNASIECTDEEHLASKQGQWTYADFWRCFPQEEFSSEVINGVLVELENRSVKHQLTTGNLMFQIETLIRLGVMDGTLCVGPIDVVMQPFTSPAKPDLVYIRQENLEIITEKNITGVPDLMIEVLSSNIDHDRRIKFDAYREAGVMEYWIVDPEAESVEVFVMRDSLYVRLALFKGKDVVRSEVMPMFAVSAETIFQ